MDLRGSLCLIMEVSPPIFGRW